jgi:hypothetical protein
MEDKERQKIKKLMAGSFYFICVIFIFQVKEIRLLTF